MKKTILAIFMVLLMSFSFAIAQEEEESGPDYTGDPYGHDIGLGFFSPLRVVGGNKCSDTSDWSKQTLVTGSSLCWNNVNGGSPGGNGVEHVGVVYQVFTTYEDATTRLGVDKKIGEVEILAGQRKCVSLPKSGEIYFRQAFYCDTEQTTCEETFPYYTAGCDFDICGEGQVLRVRGVRELVSGGCVGPNWETETCHRDLDFGITCVQGGSGGSTGGGSGGTPGGTLPNVELKGTWYNVFIPPVTTAGKEFTVRATFQAETEGRYYLEAGMGDDWNPLSIVANAGSKCDGNLHAAGYYADLTPGERIDMTFKPIAQDKAGTYSVYVGAFSGCFADGGKDISSTSSAVKVIELDHNGNGGDGDGKLISDKQLIGAGIGATIGLFGLIGGPIIGAGGVVVGGIAGLIIASLI